MMIRAVAASSITFAVTVSGSAAAPPGLRDAA
jgi:hypothetical protein